MDNAMKADPNQPVAAPTWRKPTGVAIILALIALIAFVLGSFSNEIGRLHMLLQAVIYLVAGIVWIVPLGPLLRWMETGKWRE
jgi:membrane protein YdbS with pleckstrin-like domain